MIGHRRGSHFNQAPLAARMLDTEMKKNAPENDCIEAVALAAIKHGEGDRIDQALLTIADRMRRKGHRLAGAVRARVSPPGEDRCDLVLQDLSTSAEFSLSQDLGAGSQACRLDDVALDAIAERVTASLREGADILILNKFGKQEADGRGLRDPIVKAVDQGIPVLIGLNSSRLESWNEFCGGDSAIFEPGDPAIDRWLEARVPG